MKKLAIRFGTWGAALGMLAGVVELSVGTHIRPWYLPGILLSVSAALLMADF